MITHLDFRNATELQSARLLAPIQEALTGWAVRDLTVRVRYSRGADFSGTCYYADRRIFVNVGRHLRYPYAMQTNLGRAKNHGKYWARPAVIIQIKTGYDLVLFIFLHELYHLLIRIARRNPRQKESMCDRFAARQLVDRYGAKVTWPDGSAIDREEWDFQDLDGFVAKARARLRGGKNRPVRNAQAVRAARSPKKGRPAARQLLLFA
jgi:hypothetical protein